MFINEVFAKTVDFIVKKWVEFGFVFSVPVLTTQTREARAKSKAMIIKNMIGLISLKVA